jgi:diacylglycerol kinase family enzyme
MRRRFALVFNTNAGVATARLLKSVLGILRDNGSEIVTLAAAASAAEATRRVAEVAREGSYDAVIAAGGDGTFRAVAAGAGTALPVGIVPVGTGNVLCHEIGLERRAPEIAKVLLEGPELGVRGGLVNGQPFFLMTGVGFDARVVALLNDRTKRALGRAAYAVPILRALAEKPRLIDVELDGRKFEASWVILSLASRYGGSFTLTRETGVGHDRLMAVVIEARSRFGLAGAASSLALGRLTSENSRPSGVHVFPVKVARIGMQKPAAVEVDGDAAGTSAIEVSGEGPRIRLIVPRRYVAGLTNRLANRLP